MTDLTPKDDDNLGSFYMGRMRNPPEPRRILPKGMLTAVTLFAFAAIIWYAYPTGADKSALTTIPTITADKSVYKFKPENPGGMEVPHQDSTVFDPIDSKSANADAIEKLGAPPEEPVDKDSVLTTTAPIEKKLEKLNLDMQIKEASDGTEKIVPTVEDKPQPKVDAKVKASAKPDKTVAKAEAKPVKKVELAQNDTVKTSPAATEPAAGEDVQPVPVAEEPLANPTLNAEAPKTETPAAETPVAETPKEEAVKTEAPKVEKPKTAAKPAAPKHETAKAKPQRVELMSTTAKPAPKIAPAVKGGIFIQLGSYRDLKVAKAEWAKLQKKFPQTLGKMAMQTSTADLGIKGTFHRVQAKVPTEARAKEICHLMKESGNPDCIVVH